MITIRLPSGEAVEAPFDGSFTLSQLKMMSEDISFIPADCQRLMASSEILEDEDSTLEELGLEEGMELELVLDLEGGGTGGDHRYKKARSRFRWKWNKKRTQRLQKKRRRMRQRAR